MNIRKYIKEFVKSRKLNEGFTDEGEPDTKYYAFDWDDNIVTMPTKILVKDEDGDVVGMSTEDFAHYRSIIGKEPFEYEGETIINLDNNAFRDFRKPETFLRDTKIAIQKNRQSPSFKKFKEK